MREFWGIIDDDSTWEDIWGVIGNMINRNNIDPLINFNKFMIEIVKSVLDLGLKKSDGLIKLVDLIFNFIDEEIPLFENNQELLTNILNLIKVNKYDENVENILLLKFQTDINNIISEYTFKNIYSIILLNQLEYPNYNIEDFSLYCSEYNRLYTILLSNSSNLVVDMVVNLWYKIKPLIYDWDFMAENTNDKIVDLIIDEWNFGTNNIIQNYYFIGMLAENNNPRIVQLLIENLEHINTDYSFWIGISKNTNKLAINLLLENWDVYFSYFSIVDINDSEHIRRFSLLLGNPSAFDLIIEKWADITNLLDVQLLYKYLLSNPNINFIELIEEEWDEIEKDVIFWENLAINNNLSAVKKIKDGLKNNSVIISDIFWGNLSENNNTLALEIIKDNLITIKNIKNIWIGLAYNKNPLAFKLILNNWNYIMETLDELNGFFIRFIMNQPIIKIDNNKLKDKKHKLNNILKQIHHII